MNTPKTNLPASVRHRLLNRAREKKLPFQELAQRYAIERFLSRLAQSAHTDCFILKGAQMLLVNSRMKDFHDIWTLSRAFPFNRKELSKAIAATFRHRGTELPSLPSILSATPADLADKQKQWIAFLRKSRLTQGPEAFHTLAADLADFLTPVMAPNHPAHIWTPPGPWNCREVDGASCPP